VEEWLTLAVEQGSAHAQYALDNFHKHSGVRSRFALAIKLYLESGYHRANYQVGYMLMHIRLLDQDIEADITWVRAAAEKTTLTFSLDSAMCTEVAKVYSKKRPLLWDGMSLLPLKVMTTRRQVLSCRVRFDAERRRRIFVFIATSDSLEAFVSMPLLFRTQNSERSDE